MIFRFLELLLIFMAALFIITQIITPATFRRPLFPMFRNKKLEKELSEALDELDTAAKKSTIEEVRKETRDITKEN